MRHIHDLFGYLLVPVLGMESRASCMLDTSLLSDASELGQTGSTTVTTHYNVHFFFEIYYILIICMSMRNLSNQPLGPL